MASATLAQTWAAYDDLMAVIAPTPYHRAALTGNFTLAAEAFASNIPFPDPAPSPIATTGSYANQDLSPSPLASPFSPCDLAMIYPCNYRLLTLFSIHGHRPILSETNRQRLKRWLKKQRLLQLMVLYRSTLSDGMGSALIDPESEDSPRGPDQVQVAAIETNQRCYNELLALSRELNSVYITSPPPQPRQHAEAAQRCKADIGADTDKPADVPEIVPTATATTTADGDGEDLAGRELDCEFVEFSSISGDEDNCEIDSDDEDSYHFNPKTRPEADISANDESGMVGRKDTGIPSLDSNDGESLLKGLLSTFTSLDSDDEADDLSDEVQDGEHDTETLTRDDNGDELLTADAYQSHLRSLQSAVDSDACELVNLRTLPLPNRTLLLAATTLMTETFSCLEEYMANLLAKTVTLRCLRLLEDVALGRFDFGNDQTDSSDGAEDGSGVGDTPDRQRVEREIMSIYNLQFNLADQCGTLFRKWEVVSDFETLLNQSALMASSSSSWATGLDPKGAGE